MTKPVTKPSDLKVERVPFVTLANLKSLSDIRQLSEVDLLELCTQFPKAVTQLIIDLNTAWGLAEAKAADLTKENDGYKKEIVALSQELSKALEPNKR
jgi:hypothetical protein